MSKPTRREVESAITEASYSPKLLRIVLNGTSKNEDINSNSPYLVCIYGSFAAGHFNRQHYGWNFDNWGASGIQLGAVLAVWEILVLDAAEVRP